MSFQPLLIGVLYTSSLARSIRRAARSRNKGGFLNCRLSSTSCRQNRQPDCLRFHRSIGAYSYQLGTSQAQDPASVDGDDSIRAKRSEASGVIDDVLSRRGNYKDRSVTHSDQGDVLTSYSTNTENRSLISRRLGKCPRDVRQAIKEEKVYVAQFQAQNEHSRDRSSPCRRPLPILISTKTGLYITD